MLGRHTSGSTVCWFGVWDGDGQLHGSPAVARLSSTGEGGDVAGIAPPEVRAGPRLRAPGREYLILRGALSSIQALGDLKLALEGTAVENRQFVYKTYINATPELLWKGLTDPAFTNRYWGLELVTDWKVGSPITWEHHGVTIADPAQVVLEADPFRRLAYTWHSFTPEWANASGIDEQRRATLAAETRSQVAFHIEPVGEICKLTVVHEFFEPDSTVATMVSEGWPRVLSELKTLIETGG